MKYNELLIVWGDYKVFVKLQKLSKKVSTEFLQTETNVNIVIKFNL